MVFAASQMSLPFLQDDREETPLPTFDDPTFTDNRTAPVHRWVPWIAGFSGTFVDSVLSWRFKEAKNKGMVLDPFAGVGTTLVQASLRGHRVMGFEINPYAALAANIKLGAFKIDMRELDAAITCITADALNWQNGNADPSFIPLGFRSRIPFFSPRVESQVCHALAFISRIQDQAVRDLFRVAFGSVMVSFSNYTYEPSLSTRPGAGKARIEDADVAGILLAKVRQMRSDLGWLRDQRGRDSIGEGAVYNEDFFESKSRLRDGTVDLMVTSPPYLNNYHYARNTRPQLYWLGLISSPMEQKFLEEKNFGTFWQIARAKEMISLNFDHPTIQHILSRLREKNTEKGDYGGLGWANYAASYFNDCERFLNAVRRCLKKGRYNQTRSAWDVVHPGRPWALRCAEKSIKAEDYLHEVTKFLQKMDANPLPSAV
jgi:hypothetical protein